MDANEKKQLLDDISNLSKKIAKTKEEKIALDERINRDIQAVDVNKSMLEKKIYLMLGGYLN